MEQPTAPDDRPSVGGGAGRLCDTGLAVLFAIGVVLALTRDDLRPVALLLMVVSAAVFLVSMIMRPVRQGPGR
ncbi:hypothetical protein [Clavibacter capsici]|uniref:Uncharacterized protein n=1 Tax=Clavibacter capsici TaxID=1874630 RepID=A0AAE6XMQ7_9MICO|nr:hypothetical protein [Clavibacter capsici]ALD11688.1 hypothetical protein AES38_00795 [Clavibacter capsici]QIS43742.1 hypothetical protein GW570_00800 [Clavibacter capsici]